MLRILSGGVAAPGATTLLLLLLLLRLLEVAFTADPGAGRLSLGCDCDTGAEGLARTGDERMTTLLGSCALVSVPGWYWGGSAAALIFAGFLGLPDLSGDGPRVGAAAAVTEVVPADCDLRLLTGFADCGVGGAGAGRRAAVSVDWTV